MLFEPCTIDHVGELKSRVVMTAMTRGFCGPGHTATDDMAAYYRRRAVGGVGLILTEGTIIHPSADGYNDVPYIFNDAQVESWKKVTCAVHEAKSRIYSQLWHCGRISHSDYTNGESPISSTNRAAAGENRQNGKPYGKPRALETREIPSIYGMFQNAARNALKAEFDGVELHMGHGYLVDQFFDARVNDREDAYGGSVANRCRFALELLEEIICEVGADRVIVRISPSRFMGGLYDWPNLDEMLAYVVPAMENAGLRVLDISCANADYYETSGRVIRSVRELWPHPLIGGASLGASQAEHELMEGWLDLVTWGRSILANPDFVSRLEKGQEMAEFDRDMLAELR